MSLSPICTVNGGSAPANVTGGSTVTIALQTPAGVQIWALSCTSTDDLNTAAAINATLVINSGAKTATFTAPASLGSAAIFTSTVGIGNGTSLGNGTDQNNVVQASFTTTFKVNVLASSGNAAIAANETSEQNASFGWITSINSILRNGGGVVWAADLAGSSNSSQKVVNLTGSAGLVTIPTAALAFGTNPATSGNVRVPNATTVLGARNAANSADLPVIATTGGNAIVIGDSVNLTGGVSIQTASTGMMLAVGNSVDSSAFIVQRSGSNIQLWWDTIWIPQLVQGQQANGSNPNNFTIAPQAPGAGAASTPTGTPGSLIVSIASPVSTGVAGSLQVSNAGHTTMVVDNLGAIVGRTDSSQQGVRIGPLIGSETSYGALWVGSSASSPTSGNYVLALSGSAISFFNTPGLNFGTGSITIQQTSGVGDISYTGGYHVITFNAHGLQLFNQTPAVDFGSGTGVLGITAAGTLASTVPTTGSILAVDNTTNKGLHHYGPSTSFFDELLASTCQGTANTQAGKFYRYTGVARTTTTTQVQIISIPLATSGTNAAIRVFTGGRDVTSGTVGDGVSIQSLFSYKNVAGTVSAGATVSTALASYDTSMASVVVAGVVSGTNILIKVAGLTSVTIDWTSYAEVLVT
jgi:hypothetical protein